MTRTSTPNARGVPGRIAIIAVHGVADQQAGESNAAIASLLSEHARRQGSVPLYDSFSREELHLPVRPVLVRHDGTPEVDARESASPPRSAADPERGSTTPRRVSERRHYVDRATDSRDAGAGGSEQEREYELGYQFMRMQLEGRVMGDEATTYRTTVLRGRRSRGLAQGSPMATAEVECHDEQLVDVYEVYWADLSRPASGPLAFFGTAYQLLLHLATLGRQAVDDTATEQQSWPWRLSRVLEITAVRCLTLPVPLLNLILLVVGLGVIPAKWLLATTLGPRVALSALCAGLAGAGAYLLLRRDVPRTPWRWVGAPLLSAILAACAGYLIAGVPVVRGEYVVILVWLVVGYGLVHWVAARYQQVRAGASAMARLLYLATAVAFVVAVCVAPAHASGMKLVEIATLWTMQMAFAALRVSWIGLTLSAALLLIVWPFAWWSARRDRVTWSRGRAALRTGRLAIALAASAFLVVTMVTWAGVFAYSIREFKVFSRVDAVTIAPIPGLALFVPSVEKVARLVATDRVQHVDLALDMSADAAVTVASRVTAPQYFQGMLAESVTAAAPFSLALWILAFVLLLWTALPSVRTEAGIDQQCTNAESQRMGQWLSRGLDSTRWVTHLFHAALLLPLPFAMLDLCRKLAHPGIGIGRYLDHGLHLAFDMVGTTGALVAASAVVIVGILMKVGGTALDIVLDVDNYLRTTPAHATPRARICERYVSLLRHLATDDDDGLPRYEGVVIVAHSLGALISCDLFRFLSRERERGGDPGLARFGFASSATGTIPITLFTMGNPLRQLLTRFFPHRYQWVRASPDNGTDPLPVHEGTQPVVDDFTHPDVHAMGLARWENAYRSGDYVGRSIWADEWYRRTDGGDSEGQYPQRIARVEPHRHQAGARAVAESCIGGGAHTHYWDTSAPDVAERIDALVCTAPA